MWHGREEEVRAEQQGRRPPSTPAPPTVPAGVGLVAQARQRPDALALIVDDVGVTYAALDDGARRAAVALRRLGVGVGDRVAVMVGNRRQWFEAVHGCGRLGAVAVPVNVHLRPGEAGWIVTDSAARAVVVEAGLVDALGGVPAVPRLVVDGAGDNAWDAALASAGDQPIEPPPPGDGWPTLMVYTSGTTGRPKGVEIAADDPRRRAVGVALMAARFQVSAADVHLLSGPAYHAGPAMWAHMHLAVGASVVVMRRWDARTALHLIERYRVTTCHMVPANFVRILELPSVELEGYDLSSLRLVMHAAAACPVAVKRAIMELVGVDKVWEYYGATEGGGVVIGPDEWRQHPGSVGRPVGYEVKILDEAGNELPCGVDGLVYVRSPFGNFRYHNDEVKTTAAFRGDFFTVGDIGHLDADGYLYLTDRRDDLIISGGVNVYPREIEETLFSHPAVADCAVLGVPDARWGHAVCAVVQRRGDTDLDDEGVVAWCRRHLADFKRPRRVIFVDQLPRTESGKVDRRRLREFLGVD